MSLRRASGSNRALPVGCFSFFSTGIAATCPTLAQSDSLYSYCYLKPSLFLDSLKQKNQSGERFYGNAHPLVGQQPKGQTAGLPPDGFPKGGSPLAAGGFSPSQPAHPDHYSTTERRAMRAKETPCS